MADSAGSANLDDCKQLLNSKDGFAAMSVLELDPVFVSLHVDRSDGINGEEGTWEWIAYKQPWEARLDWLAQATQVACNNVSTNSYDLLLTNLG